MTTAIPQSFIPDSQAGAPPAANSGAPSSFVPEANMDGGNPAPQEGNNFLQSMIMEPAKTLLARPVFRTVQALGGLAGNAMEQYGNMTGNETAKDLGNRFQTAAEMPMNMHVPIFGDINVEGQKTGLPGALQIGGHALETASYLVPGEGAAGAAENMVKGNLAKAVVGGAAAGGQFGLMSGAGQGLTEDNPTVGSVAASSAEQGLAGTALGAILGLGGGVAGKVIGGVTPFLSDLFSKGPKAAVSNAARQTVETELRDTAQRYVSSSRALETMEGKAGTNPIGVISSYGGKALPQLEQGKINPGEAIDFLKGQIGELSSIKSDAVKLNNSGVKLPDFQSEADSLVNNEGWSTMKQNQVRAQVNNILSDIEGTYSKQGYVPLMEVDQIKTEQTGLSKAYNNTGKDPFQYDAHAIVGKAARNIVERETGDAPTKELNKLIQSHYNAIDLLESLRGKAPHGGMLTRELSRLGGEITGSIAGTAVGHPFLGAMAGRIGADTILGVLGNDFISDPVKRMIIKNLDDVEPAVKQKALQYIEQKGRENATRLALPGKGETNAPIAPPAPTTYEAPAGNVTKHDTKPIPLLLPSGEGRVPQDQVVTPQSPTTYEPAAKEVRRYDTGSDQRSLFSNAEKNLPTNSANSTAKAIIDNDNTMNNKSGKATLGALLGIAGLTAGSTALSTPSVSHYEKPNEPAQTVTAQPSVDSSKLMNAIKYNETRGEKDPYTFSQSSGVKAYGKVLGAYQISEAELKSYAERFLGRIVSAAQFLKSPKIQDAYMKAKIEALAARGLSPDEILAVHNKGMSDMTPGGLTKAEEKAKDYVSAGMGQYKRSFEDLAASNR